MAKTPKKAWMKQQDQGDSKPMVSLPYRYDDPESVRLRAVIRGKKDDNGE